MARRLLSLLVAVFLASRAFAQASAYYVPPRINAIYAQPMGRASEIPMYGKNKYMYFYGQKNRDESGEFAGANMYAFFSYMTGQDKGGGVNQEGSYDYGSEASSTMMLGEKVTATSFGVGRKINNKLNIEFGYTSFKGLGYGGNTRLFDTPVDTTCPDGEYWDEDFGECVSEDEDEDEYDEHDCLIGEEEWDEDAQECVAIGGDGAEPPAAAGRIGRKSSKTNMRSVFFGLDHARALVQQRRSSRPKLARAEGDGECDPEVEDCEDLEEDAKPQVTVIDGYEVSGGKITSDFISAGFIYRFDNMFSRVAGGMFRPYVGAHVGLAVNKIDDYTIRDPDEWNTWTDDAGNDLDLDGYYVDDGDDGDLLLDTPCVQEDPDADPAGYCVMYVNSDMETTFHGATTVGIGYALEAGVAIPLEDNIQIEFFWKRHDLGKVRTSGAMISKNWVTTDEMYIPADGIGCMDGFEAYSGDEEDPLICIVYGASEYQDHRVDNKSYESGKLKTTQYGMKIKYFF
ncbi:MAG: hypothetical protein LBT92_00110 [Rickettsiales bacterium]|jgi:hypothetical protein|nr:hypothetical protein [Rickettsiales bacterium]